MMRRRKLFWFLFPSYVLITTGALLALGAYARVSVRGFYLAQISAGLESRAELFASEVSRRLAADDAAGLDESAKDRGQASRTRITVIAPSGLVLADSENEPATMNNHRYRKEIAVAFDERRAGDSMRYSDTMDTRYKYVAVPLVEEGEVVAVIRSSQSVAVIDRAAACPRRPDPGGRARGRGADNRRQLAAGPQHQPTRRIDDHRGAGVCRRPAEPSPGTGGLRRIGGSGQRHESDGRPVERSDRHDRPRTKPARRDPGQHGRGGPGPGRNGPHPPGQPGGEPDPGNRRRRRPRGNCCTNWCVNPNCSISSMRPSPPARRPSAISSCAATCVATFVANRKNTSSSTAAS